MSLLVLDAKKQHFQLLPLVILHYCTLKDNRGSLELLHPILSVLSPAILCISEEYASPSEFLVAATLNKKSLRKEMRF